MLYIFGKRLFYALGMIEISCNNKEQRHVKREYHMLKIMTHVTYNNHHDSKEFHDVECINPLAFLLHLTFSILFVSHHSKSHPLSR